MPDELNKENRGCGAGWDLPPCEPTNLLSIWGGVSCPGAAVLLGNLEDGLGSPARVVKEFDPPDDRLAWCMAVQLPGQEDPVVFWAESGDRLPEEDRHVHGVPEECWLVGMESHLDAGDPLGGFVRMLRASSCVVGERTPVLDVNTTRWFTADQVEEAINADRGMFSIDMLWIIHLVDADGEAGGGTWLHTHGLGRCSLPDVEMIGVHRELVPAAARLLGDIASMTVEQGVPAPGGLLPLGPAIGVRLKPWSAVSSFVSEDSPGGAAHRDSTGVHPSPVRAVVCDAEPVDAERGPCAWPREALQRIVEDDEAIYATRQATAYQSRRSQEAWDILSRACLHLQRIEGSGVPGAGILVKASMPVQGESMDREHLWFRACAIEMERVRATRVHDPVAAVGIEHGEPTWLEREQVSDWVVVTPRGRFGPADGDALIRYLEGDGV